MDKGLQREALHPVQPQVPSWKCNSLQALGNPNSAPPSLKIQYSLFLSLNFLLLKEYKLLPDTYFVRTRQ